METLPVLPVAGPSAGLPAVDAAESVAARPFLCAECGGRYTRQEHLDRHITAKHKAVKEFTCPSCGKSFARRDILRRHEQGHIAKANKIAAAAAAAGLPIPTDKIGPPVAKKRKTSPAEGESAPTGAQGGSGTKSSRTSRACDRCSRQKLRCDGEESCARCNKAGVGCSYDRYEGKTRKRVKPKQEVGEAQRTNEQGGEGSSEEDDEDDADDEEEEDVDVFAPSFGGDARRPSNGLAGGALLQPHGPDSNGFHPPGQYLLNGHESSSWAHSTSLAAYPSMAHPTPFPGNPSSAYTLPPPTTTAHRAPNTYSSQNILAFRPPTSPAAGSPSYASTSHAHVTDPMTAHNNRFGSFASQGVFGNPYLNPFGSMGMKSLPQGAQGTFKDTMAGQSPGMLDPLEYLGGDSSTILPPHFMNTESSGLTPQSGFDFMGMIASTRTEQDVEWDLLVASQAASPRDGPPLDSMMAFDPELLAQGLRASANAASPKPAPKLPPSSLGQSMQSAAMAAFSTGQATGSSGAPSVVSPPSGVVAPGMNAYRTRTASTDSPQQQDSAAHSLLQLATLTPQVAAEAEPEENSRSSMPFHERADPWPLSYHPEQPDERLLSHPNTALNAAFYSHGAGSPAVHVELPMQRDGGEFDGGVQARAMQPPIGRLDVEEVKRWVPPMNNKTWERLREHTREISRGFVHFAHSDKFIPPVEYMDRFIQLYFDRYHPLLPILHHPTFDTNSAASHLLLVIASIGARYSQVESASLYAQALSETARRMTKILTDVNNQLLRTVSWQQSNILILLAGLSSGNKRDLERTQYFSMMPVTNCRRQGWFVEHDVDEQAEAGFHLEERWKRWRDREGLKRLGFSALILDGMGSILWNFESSNLFDDATRTSLPCHDRLWEAPTATAWAALFRGSLLPPKGLNTLEAIHLVIDRTKHSNERLLACSRDVLAMATVLTILHMLGFVKKRVAQISDLFLPGNSLFGSMADPAAASIDAGLEFFENQVILPPAMQATLSEPNASSTTMLLMLHHIRLTEQLPLRYLQLLVNMGDANVHEDARKGIAEWARQDNGRRARQSAWHAGQIVGLCSRVQSATAPHNSPSEPACMFYASLALFCYAREVTPAGENVREEMVLDQLVDRGDPNLVDWLEMGNAKPSLQLLRTTLDSNSADMLLKACSDILRKLSVWRVGDLLAATLLRLVSQVEEESTGASGSSF